MTLANHPLNSRFSYNTATRHLVVLICFMFLIAVHSSYAGNDMALDTEQPDPWSGVYSIGISYGGDTLRTSSDDRELKAGGDLILGLGAAYAINDAMHAQALLGFHYASLTASNGRATFQRNSLELEVFHRMTSTMRLGYGLVHEFSARYHAISSVETYTDATGLMLEWNYRKDRFYWWGIRYTALEFDRSSANPVDAGYLALMFSGDF